MTDPPSTRPLGRTRSSMVFGGGDREPCLRLGSGLGEWGPSAWNVLHSFAQYYPVSNPSPQKKEATRNFLFAFASELPCPRCRRHFEAFLRERTESEGTGDGGGGGGGRVVDPLSSRAALVSLLNDAHNDVNRRTGKREFGLQEHVEIYGTKWRRRNARVEAEAASSLAACLVALLAASACVLVVTRKKMRRAEGRG